MEGGVNLLDINLCINRRNEFFVQNTVHFVEKGHSEIANFLLSNIK